MGKDILTILKKDKDQFLKLLKLGLDASTLKLSDPLCIDQEIKYTIDEAFSLKLGPFNLSGQIGGIHTLQLFNSIAEDKDNDGIIAVQSSNHPVLPFSESEPVIKYCFGFVANTATIGGNGLFNLGIEARSELQSITYLKHGKNENVLSAIGADIINMKFPFDLKDVLELRSGEAVSFSAKAHLVATLNFEFKDLFIAGLSQLAKVLDTDLISLEIGIGFNAGIHTVIQDFFDITFSKTTQNTYEIALTKSISRQTDASFGAQVSVGFSDPQKAGKAIESQWDSLLQMISNKLIKNDKELKAFTQKLNQFATEGKLLDTLNLKPVEKEIIDLLSKKLKIEKGESQLRELVKKVTSLKSDVSKAIEQGIQAKLVAGVKYEYSRYTSSEELLRATASPGIIEKFHPDLILFRTDALLIAGPSINKKDLTVTDYWREDNFQESRSWGIGLGIGKFKIGGSDFQEIEKKITYRVDQHKKVAYRGKGGYKGLGFMGAADRWWGLLDAEMTQFSREIEPRVSEFDFGFQLIYEHDEKRFRKSEKNKLFSLIDKAVCWSIIPENSRDQIGNDLWKNLFEDLDKKKRNREIKFRYSLNISPKVFQKLALRIQKLPAEQIIQIASAMAMVVPYSDDLEGRKNNSIRKKIYTPVWEAFLAGNSDAFFPSLFNSARVIEFVDKTHEILLAQDRAAEARFEARYELHRGPTGTIGDIVEKNSIIGFHWKHFTDGLQTLTQSIDNNTGKNYDRIIQDVFKDIKQLWSTSYGVIACGSYFVGLAGNDPAMMQNIERQLEIEYLDDNNEVQTIFLSSGKS